MGAHKHVASNVEHVGSTNKLWSMCKMCWKQSGNKRANAQDAGVKKGRNEHNGAKGK